MIENINELLSIIILIIIMLMFAFYTFTIFSKHHAKRLMELESEYYDYSDDESDDSYL